MSRTRGPQRWLLACALAAGSLAAPGVASATVYRYVEWMAADVQAGTAAGVITLPDQSTVKVTFAVQAPPGGVGNLYGAQLNGDGTNYWVPSAPYISPQVENAPPDPDILQLSGGNQNTYTLTLSEPIEDPIMAIVSLGQANVTITYDFDSPFTIVSQGTGSFGGGVTSLVQLPDDVLQGSEGNGTIQFLGTFSRLSWTVPKPESWHGFTFGIRTATRLDTTPDGGVGTGGVIGSGGVSGTGGGRGTGGVTETGGVIGAGGAGGRAGAGGDGGRAGAGGDGGGAGASGAGGRGGSGVGGTAGRVGGVAGAGGFGGTATAAGGGGASGAGGQGGHGGVAGRGPPAVAGIVGGTFGRNPSGAGGQQAQGGETAAGGADVPAGVGGAAGMPTTSGDGCSCAIDGAATLDLTTLALAAGALALARRRRRSA